MATAAVVFLFKSSSLITPQFACPSKGAVSENALTLSTELYINLLKHGLVDWHPRLRFTFTFSDLYVLYIHA